MFELAYNVNGEPFDPPPNQTAWRVRKLKAKGAPEVVYGRDGLPLHLPIDADVEDLRREGRGDGRHRLDPVDEHNRAIPNAQAAYVWVHPIERMPEPATPAPVAPVQPDSTAALVAALLESQKQHTELARMYVSQFPVIANAMAGVVRSAGDVGLTTRVPLIVPAIAEPKPDACQRETDDDEIDDEDEIDEEDALEAAEEEPAYSWPRVAQTFAEYVGPHVGPLLAGLPGLGAMLGAQPAKPKADVAPGPGPRDPAPAGAAPARTAAGFDPSLAVRLRSIMAQLTPAEQEFARSLLEEISAEEMSSWMERLRAMSVAEAVAYVRQMHDQARDAADPAITSAPIAAQSRRATTSAPTTATAPSAVGMPRREGHRAASVRDVRRGQPLTSSLTRTTPPTAPSDGMPSLDPATLTHLAAIDRALTIEERVAMRLHFASLSSGDRAEWMGTLLMLPATEAIAMVRAQLAGDAAGSPVSRGASAADPSATEPPAAQPRDSSPPTLPPAKRTAPRRTARNQPIATSSHTTSPTAAPDLVRTPATAAPEALASTEPAIAAAAATGTQPTTAEPSAIAGAELVSAAPSAGTLTRSAHTHLADIESGLAPEERLMVHTLIAGLSPEEREAWLESLLTVPPTEGVAMLRDTLYARTSERHGVPLAIGAASEPGTGSGEELDDRDDDNQAPDHDQEDGNQDDGNHEDSDQDDGNHEDNDQDDNDHEDDDQEPGSEAAITTSDALPTLDEASLAHFKAIEDALTLAEKMRAHELAAQRPAVELRAWYAELREMSVPEAVAKLRAELAHTAPRARGSKDGGVS